jgi:HD superfamily phosphodiesterase
MSSLIWDNTWNEAFNTLAVEHYTPSDASHNIQHVQRVVNLARFLALSENASLDLELIYP